MGHSDIVIALTSELWAYCKHISAYSVIKEPHLKVLKVQ